MNFAKNAILLTTAFVLFLSLANWPSILAQDAKPKPLVVNPVDFENKADLKEKYDGKLVQFMGVAGWTVEDKNTEKPWFRLVRQYTVLPPKDDDAKKKQTAKAEVKAYITGNRGQAEGELNKWRNSRYKIEFTVQGVMKVGDEIVIEDARLTFMHRIPR